MTWLTNVFQSSEKIQEEKKRELQQRKQIRLLPSGNGVTGGERQRATTMTTWIYLLQVTALIQDPQNLLKSFSDYIWFDVGQRKKNSKEKNVVINNTFVCMTISAYGSIFHMSQV